jgi:hypothetical protein
MHDITIVRITPENIGDDLTKSLREDTLIDVLDGIVHVFFGCTDATHHISVVHLTN